MSLTLDDLLAMVGMIVCVLPLAAPFILLNPDLTDDLFEVGRGVWRWLRGNGG